MSDVVPPMHAFNHAPAALRIFRFAADSAPRVLEIAHVSAFLRECAVEFGSADAALPGAMRNEAAARGRYATLRDVVERNAARCPWLVEKLVACRSAAPVPAAALARDVTRHDVNWGAEGARRHKELQPTHGGFGLAARSAGGWWAQGPNGATSGKHFFQVSVTSQGGYDFKVGFVDAKISTAGFDAVSWRDSSASGATFYARGHYSFGPSANAHMSSAPPAILRPCAVGCMLDMDATPARMTVFVDGDPLEVQCRYDFPKDGRAWFPSVALYSPDTTLLSCETRDTASH
jgi:hypothetical protein